MADEPGPGFADEADFVVVLVEVELARWWPGSALGRELLGIDKDTELEVRTDGEALIIRPAKLSKKARVRASVKKMSAIHEETLRKLSR